MEGRAGLTHKARQEKTAETLLKSCPFCEVYYRSFAASRHPLVALLQLPRGGFGRTRGIDRDPELRAWLRRWLCGYPPGSPLAPNEQDVPAHDHLLQHPRSCTEGDLAVYHPLLQESSVPLYAPEWWVQEFFWLVGGDGEWSMPREGSRKPIHEAHTGKGVRWTLWWRCFRNNWYRSIASVDFDRAKLPTASESWCRQRHTVGYDWFSPTSIDLADVIITPIN